MKTSVIGLLTCAIWLAPAALRAQVPQLRDQGTAKQLIVDGQPYLVLGGELLNSSSSNLDYMKPIWGRLVEMNFNTVLAGMSWELVEPVEGQYDFRLVDGLIEGARQNNLRLVFLWFGSWKNGMSSYIPLWVKKDFRRFPRAQIKDGQTVEVLSTFSPSNWEADARAFAALMRHIKEVDGAKHTVIMMQVENEVGILKDSRDRSPIANKRFSDEVPKQLMDYLVANKGKLYPDFRKRWEEAGGRSSGTWEQVFGAGPATDEIFMAWNYANYIDKVTAAGKAQYPLPMFVNTWLSMALQKPGDWPSGGPLPTVSDVWHVGAPRLDMLTPDIYTNNFQEWCQRYVHGGNPLFIPEMMPNDFGAKNIFYAIGQHSAIGTSPFAVDAMEKPAESPLAKSYGILKQVAPQILSHQGKNEMTGFVLNKEQPSVKAEMAGYELEISLDLIFGMRADSAYGLIIATGPNEFLAAGSGFMVSFTPKTPGPKLVGVGAVDEGAFSAGKWVPGRRLNGDETDQGQHWRLPTRQLSIQKCVVYRYE
jgi:beta-galactosidase GanA